MSSHVLVSHYFWANIPINHLQMFIKDMLVKQLASGMSFSGSPLWTVTLPPIFEVENRPWKMNLVSLYLSAILHFHNSKKNKHTHRITVCYIYHTLIIKINQPCRWIYQSYWSYGAKKLLIVSLKNRWHCWWFRDPKLLNKHLAYIEPCKEWDLPTTNLTWNI